MLRDFGNKKDRDEEYGYLNMRDLYKIFEAQSNQSEKKT